MSKTEKSPLEKFLERLVRVKVFKFGQIEDRFFILDEPKEIYEVVEIAKKWCNRHNLRFMGARPLFETFKDIDDRTT